MTLKIRFLLVTVITTMAVAMAVILANQLTLHRHEMRFLQTTIDHKRAFWDHLVTNVLADLRSQVVALTRDPIIKQALQENDPLVAQVSMSETFNRLSAYGTLSKLQIADKSGNVIVSLPDGFTGKTRKGVVFAALNRGMVVGGIERDDDGELVAVIATPLYANRAELIGVAIFEQDLRDAMQPFTAHAGTIAYIVDAAGIVGSAVGPAMFLAGSDRMPGPGENRYSIERWYDRAYQVTVLSLSDYLGKPLAHLVTINDYTESYLAEQTVTYISYAIIILVLVLSLLALYWFVVMESDRLRAVDQQRNHELRIANTQLQEALRVKSDFLANMSHELRTPLNAIIGFSGGLLQGIDGDLNEEQKISIGHVNSSGEHLLRLINDVLDLSKIEAGKMVLNLETVDLAELIEDTMQNVSVLFRAKGLILRKEIFERIPVVYGDNTRIKQVLLNILSNAAKFTEKGEVVVDGRTVQVDDDIIPAEQREHMPYQTHWILISIRDTGVGIRKADKTKIFEKFRQIDSGSARKYRGTGLGMAISRRIVQMHGGDMWVESEFGKGTIFYFTIPLHYFEWESTMDDETHIELDTEDLATASKITEQAAKPAT